MRKPKLSNFNFYLFYFLLFFLGLGDFKCNASKKINKQKIVQFKTVCLLAEDFTFQEEKMLM